MRIAGEELLLCLLMLGISLLFLGLSFDLPTMRGDPGGPGLWPQLMAFGTGGGVIALLCRRLLTGLKSEAGAWPGRRTWEVMAASLLYPPAILLVGLAPATVVYVALLMWRFGASRLEILLFPAAFAAVIQLLFVYLLEATVPQGWLLKVLW